MAKSLLQKLMAHRVDVSQSDVDAVEKDVQSRNPPEETASEFICAMAERKGVQLFAHQSNRAKVAQHNRQVRSTTDEFNRTLGKMADLARAEGIRAFGEAEFDRLCQARLEKHLEPNPELHARYSREMSEEAEADDRVKPDKRAMMFACTERMGAPRLQIRNIIAAEGVLRGCGKDENGEELRLEPTTAIAMIDAWIRAGRKPSTVCLSGAASIGKTTAALYCLYKDAYDRNGRSQSRCFYSAHQLARISNSMSGVVAENYESLYRVRTLVIDNLMPIQHMPSSTSGAFTGLFLDILDQRQNSGLSTIVTTTMEYRDMIKSYGLSIFSHFTNDRGMFNNLPPLKIQNQKDGGPMRALPNRPR